MFTGCTLYAAGDASIFAPARLIIATADGLKVAGSGCKQRFNSKRVFRINRLVILIFIDCI
ncbi:MAG TPA: hypothetical protein VLE21_02655 [Candidatus Nitrosocosmicus sp.]|nr:hypothetical protein [Candidatus Nitrosocosmicus sp.]